MDPQRLKIFRDYEKSMEKILKNGLKRDTDPQLRKIAENICYDWGKIMKLLGFIGTKLADHYKDVEYVCRDNGMLIEKA